MKITLTCPCCDDDIPVPATSHPTPGNPFSITVTVPLTDMATHLKTCPAYTLTTVLGLNTQEIPCSTTR